MSGRGTAALVALAVVIVWAGGAGALIPPIPEAERTAQADVVVTGRVLKTEKDGEVRHDHCYGWQPWKATFAVESAEKGAVKGEVVLRYDERVVADKGCVGGMDSFSLAEGKRYKLWLRADGAAWRPFNRTCVELLPDEGAPAPE